jgi:tetratricopeptide (TPR) repeat protein
MTSRNPAARPLRTGPLRTTRHLALAVALATGTVLAGTFGFADAAYAQKKKKGGAQAEYSKEFVAAFQPLDAAVKAEGANIPALKPQLDEIAAMAQTPAERAMAGVLVLNAGIISKDQPMQLKGLDLAVKSGNLTPEENARFNFLAYQTASNLEQYGPARGYLRGAIDGNFTTESITAADLIYSEARLDFAENKHREGLKTLTRAIEMRLAAGQEVPAGWYGTGIRAGLENELTPDIYDFMEVWIANNPTRVVWRDAINIVRRLNNYEDRGSEDMMLDLLRLSRNIGTLDTAQDYLTYVEVARAARYPQEVKDVVDKGFASGKVARSDDWVIAQLRIADKGIALDRAELDKDLARAKTSTKPEEVLGTARTLLSYDRYDEAAQLFTRALDMPGTPRGEVLQRLGMAQLGMGDYAAAVESFNKVDDARTPVSRLWAAYAIQRKNGKEITG